MIGDSGIGKCCLMHRMCHNEFTEDHEVTVGVEFGSLLVRMHGINFKLQIWDTAGHEDLGRLRPIAYANTDCFIICFDLMQRNSLENACNKWLAEIKTCAKACPVILVGTKLDLREEYERNGDTDKLRDCVSEADIAKAAKDYAFQGFESCSAKEKKGLNKVFHKAFKVVF